MKKNNLKHIYLKIKKKINFKKKYIKYIKYRIYKKFFKQIRIFLDDIEMFFYNEDFNKNKKFKNILQYKIKKPIKKEKNIEKNIEKIFISKEINIPKYISITDLAEKMSINVNEIIKILFNMGNIITLNDKIDKNTACLIVKEIGHIPIGNDIEKIDIEKIKVIKKKYTGIKCSRAPIVTFMGHVDHGKTSLLYSILYTKKKEKEVGGITQYLSVFNIIYNNKEITFIDTPGHAAFSYMRIISIKATDIIVLVIAADDGIMPQTIESIKYIQKMNIYFIVAINKIDSPGANIKKIHKQLSLYKIISEEYNGNTKFVLVSAKTGEGINDLLNSILSFSEKNKLSAVINAPAKGIVIESKMDKGYGLIIKGLVLNGTLKKRDMLKIGNYYGKVRLLINESGKQVDKVGPSIPIEIIGINGIIESGEEFNAINNETKVRNIIKNNNIIPINNVKNNKNIYELNFLIKTDVKGILKAVTNALNNFSNDKINIIIFSSNIGNITVADVELAISYNGIIIAFNVKAENTAIEIIKRESIIILYHNIIYKLLDEIKKILNFLTYPEFINPIVGVAIVKNIFNQNKLGVIAGCIITQGTIYKGNKIRLLRDNKIIFQGILESIRYLKENITEAKLGTECGIIIKNFNTIKIGDKIEVLQKN